MAGLALSAVAVPARANASPSGLSAAKTIQCTVTNVQYRVRRDHPYPYARPGQDPYDGGIRNVLVVKVTGVEQKGLVTAKYIVTGQKRYRSVSNVRGKYVSVGYGTKDSMTVWVVAQTSRGAHLPCGSQKVPRVKKPGALRSIPESAFRNHWF